MLNRAGSLNNCNVTVRDGATFVVQESMQSLLKVNEQSSGWLLKGFVAQCHCYLSTDRSSQRQNVVARSLILLQNINKILILSFWIKSKHSFVCLIVCRVLLLHLCVSPASNEQAQHILRIDISIGRSDCGYGSGYTHYFKYPAQGNMYRQLEEKSIFCLEFHAFIFHFQFDLCILSALIV